MFDDRWASAREDLVKLWLSDEGDIDAQWAGSSERFEGAGHVVATQATWWQGKALAAARMEERTTVEVRRIHSKWAGLRTFTPDRRPAVGFAPDDEKFFWLAGQGGAGLQTSPAIAKLVESIVAGTPWPVADVAPAELAPERFLGQPA